MNNLYIYDAVRDVPAEAKTPIKGGRLKGKTDINPMWRIKCLTEQFGPCGIGWYYDITETWTETSMAKDEITANVKINLYYKDKDDWSKPIQGIGGSMLLASERNGLYVNDECYKMALTDAISVACKALGVGADVYWQSDNTKYNDAKKDNAPKAVPKSIMEEVDEFLEGADEKISKADVKLIDDLINETDANRPAFMEYYGLDKLEDMTIKQKADAVMRLSKKNEQGVINA